MTAIWARWWKRSDARPCREQGRLKRAVTLEVAPSSDGLAELFWSLLSGTGTPPEVVLIICPAAICDAEAWARTAEALQAILDAHGDGAAWVVAPFHPESTGDAATPGRLVPLLRRTPDPTLQLVSRAALARVHAGSVDDTRWIDPRLLTAELPPREPGPSERIAADNHRTVQAFGLERLLRLLVSLRDG